MKDFDFDAWMSLAQAAPHEFEQQRLAVLEEAIGRGDDIRRMRGLQCRIDLERTRARTPLKTCLRLSGLMWDSFLEFREQLNAPRIATPSSGRKSAEVVPFSGRP